MQKCIVSKKVAKENRGFTIFELLIVIAIMGVITSVVVFNYQGSADSENTKTSAGKLVVAIREAQTWGTASRPFPTVAGGTLETLDSEVFDRGYGVYVADNSNEFITYGGFRNDVAVVTYDPSADDEQLVSSDFYAADVEVLEICIDHADAIEDDDDSNDDCINEVSSVNIHFRRPNLAAVITDDISDNEDDAFDSVVITLGSETNSDYLQKVIVWDTGIFYTR
jgi:prepilin-type N-terminal cleavage/methylation domain-containing protein